MYLMTEIVLLLALSLLCPINIFPSPLPNVPVLSSHCTLDGIRYPIIITYRSVHLGSDKAGYLTEYIVIVTLQKYWRSFGVLCPGIS